MYFGEFSSGMSKRFYAACAAMQGILANPDSSYVKLNDPQKAEYALIMADHLLNKENEQLYSYE